MDEQNAEKVMSLECTSTPGRSWPGASLCKSLKHGWQWRRLKWAVAAASDAAQGHEANGVRPGAQEYKTLYNEVATRVQQYSRESGDPLATLQARLPALCAIERLAHPDPTAPQNKLGLTLAVMLAGVLGSIGIGALIGLGTGMAHWIAHLFA